MKRALIGIASLSLVFTIAWSALAQPHPEPSGEVFALEALNDAVASGQIDEATRGLYLLYLIKAPERLPATFRRPIEPDIHCLTGLMIEAVTAIRGGPPSVRDLAGQLLADPPPRTAGFLDSERYDLRIYYQEESDVALAESVLVMAESGYGAHIDRGWTPPMTMDHLEQPVERLDVYLVDMEYMGYCEPLANNDLTPRTDTLSRCHVNRAEDPFVIEGTVVHEMDHAFQMGEDAIELAGAYEMFCVHTTHDILPDDPYWLYFIPEFQSEPHRAIHIPLMSNHSYHYGSALFAEFLDEHYGTGDGSLAPQLWQAARQDGTVEIDGHWTFSLDAENEPDLFDAIDDYLQEDHASSFDQALVEFAEWRLLLGDYDDGEHFYEGQWWNGAEITFAEIFATDELPVVEGMVTMLPEPTGTTFIRIDTDELEGAEQLRLSVDLEETTRWAVQVIRIFEDAPAEVNPVEIEESTGGALVTAAGAEHIVLTVTNLGGTDLDGDDYPLSADDFTYSLELLSQPTVTAVEPNAATAGMSGVEVTVTASPLSPEATVDFGDGITVGEVTVDGSSLTTTLDIDVTATPGPRDVTVINPESDPGLLEGGFEVLAPPAPVLESVDPGELEQGEHVVLTVTGAGILDSAEVTLGAGITISSVDVAEATRMLVTVDVDSAAAPGPRDLVVTNPGGNAATLEGAVEVIAGSGDGDGDGDADGDGDGDSDSDSDADADADGDGGCECRQAAGGPTAGHTAPLLLAGLLLALLRRR